MSRWNNHPTCPSGCGQLADECDCAYPSPLGSIRVRPAWSISDGCCDACSGRGHTGGELCFDCYATGHCHAPNLACGVSS